MADSPGPISGNGVQLPVNLTVDLCGNTVNVAGALNPAAGNTCANEGKAATTGAQGASSGGGATANGVTKDSPGVVSGNGVQLPVHLPDERRRNSANVVGIANPGFGNESVDVFGEAQPAEPAPQPPVRHNPPSEPRHAVPRTVPVPRAPALAPQAAARGPQAAARGAVSSPAPTGADATLPALAGSTAMVLGGAALYGKFRPRTER